MEIEHRVENDILIFTIKGRLDAATSPIAEEKINNTLTENTARLLFDLSALEYLSSGGLRVILAAAKEIRRREGKVALAALTPYVYEIFEVSGFTAMIPIKETVEEALADLAA
ncbi:MAG: STAS domain-containing protein [Desulfobacterales bacterium]|jgi:anti-sigma B factor antagonist/stage II sporulation protein AA (anti-sigma F factor antagonist)